MRKSLMVVVLLLLSAGSLRAEGLRADLTLSSQWLGAGDDVHASVTIANDSTRTVLVPRWLVPGARLDADLFAVSRDGEPVSYLGRLVKRSASTLSDTDFVPLAPGATLSGLTELTRHYDMGGGGEYVVSYRIDLLEGFRGEEGADNSGAFRETVESNAVAVWREGPAAPARPAWNAALAGEGSLTTQNCSTSQSNQVSTAVNNATNDSTGARSYLDGRTWSTVGARYTTWFGAANSARFNTVSSHFTAIRNAFQTAPIVVDCGCDEPYYAYVYPSLPYTIYVCNAFWTAPATGTDSKAGTLVHELSHFNVVAATDDHAYGQSNCRGLATSQPNLAVENADSHEYFAENTPPLEGGGSAGTIRFAQGAGEIDESAGTVTLTARREGGSTGAVSVHYATSNGTASAPADYGSTSGLLAWDSGVSSDLSFTVHLVDDAAPEADETFTVVLSSPTGGATLGGPSTSTVTILDDDDCMPSVCVPDANTLCLAGGSGSPNRFRVRVTWTDFQGNSGPGTALSYTADSGFFYFFDPLILELLVKIVNGCGANGAYWFFYGSTSNVALEYTVEDLQACETETVTVPLGQFASSGDTEFFDRSCP